jgi:hypothetical protein
MYHRSTKINRRSIRLRDYDYSQAGLYFFTICTYRRQLLFGDVTNSEIKLNELGRSFVTSGTNQQVFVTNWN